MGREIPLRCECGTVAGVVQVRGFAVHGACYCRDCQAFARHLGRPERMLDAAGGTEVIGTLPASLQITSGQEQLACVTLTPRGPYRWYADCCRTAIGNTPRSPKIPVVTLHCHALALPREELDRALGRATFAFATDAASQPVARTPVGFALMLPKMVLGILWGRISGAWRSNPFFKTGTGEPLRAPVELSRAERYALRGDSPPDTTN